jgi:hypothetical protein
MRRDFEVGRGTVTSLQSQKDVKKVESGSEFGMHRSRHLQSRPGDTLQAFKDCL